MNIGENLIFVAGYMCGVSFLTCILHLIRCEIDVRTIYGAVLLNLLILVTLVGWLGVFFFTSPDVWFVRLLRFIAVIGGLTSLYLLGRRKW